MQNVQRLCNICNSEREILQDRIENTNEQELQYILNNEEIENNKKTNISINNKFNKNKEIRNRRQIA